MAQDVLEKLANESTFALAKAKDNLSVCQNFMGLLGKTIWEAHTRGKSIFRVSIGGLQWSGNALRAKIEFRDGSEPDTISMNFLGRVEGMRDFVAKKSANLVRVLEKNPSYAEFLKDLVEKLEAFALQKGKKFSEIEIIKAFIDHEDFLVLEIL